VKRNNAVFSYTPSFNDVTIQGPDSLHIFHPWPGPNFQSLKKEAQNPNAKWQEQYGKDEATGRDCVFVRYVDKNAGMDASFWYQIDLESQLPIRIKIWNNPNWDGTPDVVMEVAYNLDIPDETFNFPISAKSLQVNDDRKKTPKSEKNFSIVIPGGTCKFPEIVEDTLKARAAQQPATQSK